jgi:hypothetical protein
MSGSESDSDSESLLISIIEFPRLFQILSSIRSGMDDTDDMLDTRFLRQELGTSDSDLKIR